TDDRLAPPLRILGITFSKAGGHFTRATVWPMEPGFEGTERDRRRLRLGSRARRRDVDHDQGSVAPAEQLAPGAPPRARRTQEEPGGGGARFVRAGPRAGAAGGLPARRGALRRRPSPPPGRSRAARPRPRAR